MTDPIADMLTRMRNAIAARHSRVDIPASKLKLEIARILKEEGYINNYVTKGEGPRRTIRIFLRYDARGASSISHLSRVSTPGGRDDRAPHHARRLRGGAGCDTLPPPGGVLGASAPRRENVGGEVL